MKFQILSKNESIKTNKNSIYLSIDLWNDYSFITMFYLNYFDENGLKHPIGNIKIGFKGQTTDIATYEKIQEINSSTIFDKLPDNFFSLGQDTDYYENIYKLPDNVKDHILNNLNDIVQNTNLFDQFQTEDVMRISLLRGVRENTIKGQFTRILQGKSLLTDFNFFFIRDETEEMGKLKLEFNISPESNPNPSTNIHAIIGRNGVGKTTLLNGMIKSFLNEESNLGNFYRNKFLLPWSTIIDNELEKISDNYFSRLVAVSFSVFDPFTPQNKDNEKQNYFYIGLKEDDGKLKEPSKYFEQDFIENFDVCQAYEAKKQRWLKAIETLESDDNFASMNLKNLLGSDKKSY